MRVTFLLPGLGLTGGSRSTFELANGLHDRGHQVQVVHPLLPCDDLGAWYDVRRQIRRLGAAVWRWGKGGTLSWFDLRVPQRRVPTFHEFLLPASDVVVATWWANAYDAARLGPKHGEKVYFVRHYETWGGPKEQVDASYRLPLYRIVTSKWLKRLLERRFGVRVHGIVPNEVNLDLFHREREGYAMHRPPRVGMMYRRQAWKGMQDGLEAFGRVRKERPDVEFVLFGRDLTPEDARIVQELKRVRHIRNPYGQALRRVYNSLDIFVFPSHHEGFGNPPMEAMACGVACVTTEVGGVPEYTRRGETAWVVPPRRPDLLAEAVLGLLGDEAHRATLAEAGHRHIQRFTWDRSVARLEQVLTAIVRGEVDLESRPAASSPTDPSPKR